MKPMRKPPIFKSGPDLIRSIHPLFASGQGFAPDIMSESGFNTLPEASGTKLEMVDPIFGKGQFEIRNINPPYGFDGMMPPPFMEKGPLQPGITEEQEGVGGAGSFLTSAAIGAKG